MQAGAKHSSFDVMGLLTRQGCTVSQYRENQVVYSQGDPADSVFYVHTGRIKVTVISEHGKEAIVAIRGPDEFCGEGALTGQPLRLATVTAMSPSEIARLETQALLELLHREQDFARALLLLANYGGDLGAEPVPVKVNQETLAALIGTTRSRVNLFMNKFRKLGLIDYNGKLEVRKALLNYVLNERPHIDN
jgi:CRP/FNR family transcriptional regulator, cyclic AMP receptor protein